MTEVRPIRSAWPLSSAGFARAIHRGEARKGGGAPLRWKGEDIGAACGQLAEREVVPLGPLTPPSPPVEEGMKVRGESGGAPIRGKETLLL